MARTYRIDIARLYHLYVVLVIFIIFVPHSKEYRILTNKIFTIYNNNNKWILGDKLFCSSLVYFTFHDVYTLTRCVCVLVCWFGLVCWMFVILLLIKIYGSYEKLIPISLPKISSTFTHTHTHMKWFLMKTQNNHDDDDDDRPEYFLLH